MAWVPIIQGVMAIKNSQDSDDKDNKGKKQNKQSNSPHALLIRSWDDSVRRDQTAIRGPPPKESVSMVKYIVIAVIIIAIILIYYGIGRKWVEPPKYQSVFDHFTPDRMVIPTERRPTRLIATESSRIFGVLPKANK